MLNRNCHKNKSHSNIQRNSSNHFTSITRGVYRLCLATLIKGRTLYVSARNHALCSLTSIFNFCASRKFRLENMLRNSGHSYVGGLRWLVKIFCLNAARYVIQLKTDSYVHWTISKALIKADQISTFAQVLIDVSYLITVGLKRLIENNRREN